MTQANVRYSAKNDGRLSTPINSGTPVRRVRLRFLRHDQAFVMTHPRSTYIVDGLASSYCSCVLIASLHISQLFVKTTLLAGVLLDVLVLVYDSCKSVRGYARGAIAQVYWSCI